MKRAIPIIKVILAAVLIFSLAMMARTMYERRLANDSHDDARAAALPSRPSAGAPVTRPGAASGGGAVSGSEQQQEELEPWEELLLLDLSALREVNPEVMGWVEIPGTEISYPLLQAKDNDYYLTHLWNKKRSASGSIFMDYRDDPSLEGFHTVIYGHRMKDGTMFAGLKNYSGQEFLAEHPSVYVALEDGVYRYDVFSAREASVSGVVYRHDIEDAGLEEEFVQDCKKSSVIDSSLDPGAEDRFLTLSTCTGRGYATRWVVHGVLAQVYERPEAG